MTLREVEAESIRRFVESCAEHFTGRVLDYGCGQQPYRDIVEQAGGDYYGFDRLAFGGNVSGADIGSYDHFGHHRFADAILCTQVLQYVPPEDIISRDERGAFGLLDTFAGKLGSYSARPRGGALVLTYPTHWPEVEEADLHRFTKAGMTRLLVDAGFVIDRHERRAEFVAMGETFAVGYGVVARAT